MSSNCSPQIAHTTVVEAIGRTQDLETFSGSFWTYRSLRVKPIKRERTSLAKHSARGTPSATEKSNSP